MFGRRFVTVTDTAINCDDRCKRAQAVEVLVSDYEMHVDGLVRALAVYKNALEIISRSGDTTPIDSIRNYAETKLLSVSLTADIETRLAMIPTHDDF